MRVLTACGSLSYSKTLKIVVQAVTFSALAVAQRKVSAVFLLGYFEDECNIYLSAVVRGLSTPPLLPSERPITVTQSISLSTLRCNVSGPMALYRMSSQVIPNLILISSQQFISSLNLASKQRGQGDLLVETEVKRALSALALSVSTATKSPTPFSNKPVFPLFSLLLLMQQQKLFWMPLMLHPSVNSSQALGAYGTYYSQAISRPSSNWA